MYKTKCEFPNCNKPTASETKNLRYSKHYCEEHSKGIKVPCSVCGKELIYKPGDYIEILQTTGIFRCHKCFMKIHNSSKAMREKAAELGKKYGSKNIIKYNTSEKGRAMSAIIGKNYGIPAIQKQWVGTNEHLKQITELGNIYGKLTHDKNFKNWIGSKDHLEHISNLGSKNNWTMGNNYQWCEKCQRETLHNSRVCCKCHPESSSGFKSYFKEENKCNIHPNENLSYKDICWSCYKEQFKSEKVNIFKNYNFSLIPTFRSSKDSWNGDLQAFQQYLVDSNIGWNVYIKFYINNKNETLPLVCGKSGSFLVNSSGHDLSFSTDVSHGPARKFLYENNFQWNYNIIAILSVDSELEALKIENEIIEKYKLFGS